MKVVAFNGSPKKEGNTYHAIKIVADELEKQGIETEIVHVGNKIIKGCMAWVMKLIENGKDSVKAPDKQRKIFTNFIC